MLQFSKASLMLVSLLALTATASAEPNSDGGQRWGGGQYDHWQSKRDFYQKLIKKHHKPKPIPIDPGRGDGKPLEPVHQPPQGPPGFIWVNGHWERVKAPVGHTVVVRDHRTQGSVVIRDHRTPGSVVIRDHRRPNGGWQVHPQDASSSPGGVTVTDTPHQPVVRDHRGR